MLYRELKLGLIGKTLNYSFSKTYFEKKFQTLGLTNHSYQNFELPSLVELTDFIKNEALKLNGFNVTIPYKQDIISFLDEKSEEVKKIGAVNTVLIKNNKLIGYNTDYYGFLESIKPFLKSHHKKALILGTGGASKAVAYALSLLKIDYIFVSRSPLELNQISYNQIDGNLLNEFNILINTTPIGTFPKVYDFPTLPYQFLTEKHLCYDLVYNPEETAFLKKAKLQNSIIINGKKMLELQAEKAWEIWNL